MSNDESEHKYHFSNALISKEKWARVFGGEKESFNKADVSNALEYSRLFFAKCGEVFEQRKQEEERQDEN